MATMKIGIMPREQFQKRVLDIAAGRYVPKKGEPKVWFPSIKSLSAVLSENNLRLLNIIEEKKPETIAELAKLTNREVTNLSRTLKTMENNGIVKLIPHNKAKQPVAKATQFDIKYGYRYG